MHADLAALYAQARLDPARLGVPVEHVQDHGGQWHAVVPIDDWLLVCQLALVDLPASQIGGTDA